MELNKLKIDQTSKDKIIDDTKALEKANFYYIMAKNLFEASNEFKLFEDFEISDIFLELSTTLLYRGGFEEIENKSIDNKDLFKLYFSKESNLNENEQENLINELDELEKEILNMD